LTRRLILGGVSLACLVLAARVAMTLASYGGEATTDFDADRKDTEALLYVLLFVFLACVGAFTGGAAWLWRDEEER